MRPRRVVAMCGPKTERGSLVWFALALLPQVRMVWVPDAAGLTRIAEPALILCEKTDHALLAAVREQWPWVKVVAFGEVHPSLLPLVHVQVRGGACFLPRLRGAVVMALTRKRGPRSARATVEPQRQAVLA